MSDRPGWRAVGPLAVVLRMAVGLAVFVFAGYGLDVVLNTVPWLTLGGTVLGVLAVLADLVYRSRRGNGRDGGAGA